MLSRGRDGYKTLEVTTGAFVTVNEHYIDVSIYTYMYLHETTPDLI